MTDSPFTFSRPHSVQVTAALESVNNVLLSMWALTAGDAVSVDSWITHAGGRLTAEQSAFNRLIFAAFGSALLPEDPIADFDGYLDALALQPATLFHSRLSAAVQTIEDTQGRAEAAAQLANPQEIQQRIVEHLRILWDGMLAAEWKRHAFHLAGMTRSINELIFSQPRWQEMPAVDALRQLLLTEPNDDQIEQVAGVRRIMLVWSPHLLAHCSRFGSNDTLWVVRKFDPQVMRRDPLSRAEVMGPLSALADDTRLRILEFLAEQGEQRGQEIVAQLDGSQGNVSRHLKQLVGAGFVRERRVGDANKHYEFDPAGLQRLLYLLRQLLSSHNVQSVGIQRQRESQLKQVRASAPATLHGFFDKQGRITRWSSKLKEQRAMLEFLVAKFEPGRDYSEKEVNDLLQQWYLDPDFVLIRRSMIDAGLLQRTKDGARYWRA
jgi:DNA-binding transcriptional ArsR family regulator